MNRSRALSSALALAATFSASHPAHAGPTVAADLDLGTPVGRGISASIASAVPSTGPVASLPALYVVGFRVRAGWRFDVGPVWLLPEIGGGYDVERTHEGTGIPRIPPASRLRRRARRRVTSSRPSFASSPGSTATSAMRGTGSSAAPTTAWRTTWASRSTYADRLRYLIVGAQVGYDVVTVWEIPAGELPPSYPAAPHVRLLGVRAVQRIAASATGVRRSPSRSPTSG